MNNKTLLQVSLFLISNYTAESQQSEQQRAGNTDMLVEGTELIRRRSKHNSHLGFDKKPKRYIIEKTSSLTVLGQLDIYMYKDEIDPLFHPAQELAPSGSRFQC